jgi:polyphenol oxidase
MMLLINSGAPATGKYLASKRESGMTSLFKKSQQGAFRIRSSPQGVDIGVAGRETNRTDYGIELPVLRKREKELLNKITGISAEKQIFLDQVHGDRVIRLDNYPENDLVTYDQADGVVTGLSGICLVIRTADCVPVFAYDPVNRIIGASHSGWKGTMLNISSRMVELMCSEYGSERGNISIYILPSIGPSSYEVKNDVADHFKGFTDFVTQKIYLNLWKHIETSLVETGMRKENIFNSRVCTVIDNKDFFSHRKGDRGRNLNFGYMRP